MFPIPPFRREKATARRYPRDSISFPVMMAVQPVHDSKRYIKKMDELKKNYLFAYTGVYNY